MSLWNVGIGTYGRQPMKIAGPREAANQEERLPRKPLPERTRQGLVHADCVRLWNRSKGDRQRYKDGFIGGVDKGTFIVYLLPAFIANDDGTVCRYGAGEHLDKGDLTKFYGDLFCVAPTTQGSHRVMCE